MVLLKIGQSREAVKAATRALELVPAEGENARACRSEILHVRSRASWKVSGNLHAAVTDLNELLTINPDDLDALELRAILHSGKGRR